MQHLYIFNCPQNGANSPCEIVVDGGRSDAAALYRLDAAALYRLDAAALYRLDAVAVGGHPVGAVRRTIEGDVT